MANQKGFTLVELMVIVLIIGILVAVGIPVFGSAADKARERAEGVPDEPEKSLIPNNATDVEVIGDFTIFYLNDDCFMLYEEIVPNGTKYHDLKACCENES